MSNEDFLCDTEKYPNGATKNCILLSAWAGVFVEEHWKITILAKKAIKELHLRLSRCWCRKNLITPYDPFSLCFFFVLTIRPNKKEDHLSRAKHPTCDIRSTLFDLLENNKETQYASWTLKSPPKTRDKEFPFRLHPINPYWDKANCGHTWATFQIEAYNMSWTF